MGESIFTSSCKASQWVPLRAFGCFENLTFPTAYVSAYFVLMCLLACLDLASKFYAIDHVYRVISIGGQVHKLIVSLSVGPINSFLAFWESHRPNL